MIFSVMRSTPVVGEHAHEPFHAKLEGQLFLTRVRGRCTVPDPTHLALVFRLLVKWTSTPASPNYKSVTPGKLMVRQDAQDDPSTTKRNHKLDRLRRLVCNRRLRRTALKHSSTPCHMRRISEAPFPSSPSKLGNGQNMVLCVDM